MGHEQGRVQFMALLNYINATALLFGRTVRSLQSSRVLLDTPILAGIAAGHSNYHGFAIYIYSLESVSSRVPPLL